MKKLAGILAGASLLIAAGSAWALPTLPDSDYSWVNAPFWTNTDKTTTRNGNSQFIIEIERFADNRDSSFGLFTVDDINNPSSIVTPFEIFSKSDEPGVRKTITFWNDNGTMKITTSSSDPNSWVVFDDVFGFYFGFDNNTLSGPESTDYYYSYSPFDTGAHNQAGPNVFTAMNSDTSEVLIFLDRDNTNPAINMQIYGNDLAPVPEPSTLLLLGGGLLGLGFYGRKRMKA